MWYWIGVLLATIGVLTNAMIVLVTGPTIERLLARRGRAPAR